MKKILFLLFSTMIVFSACHKDGEEPEQNQPDAQATGKVVLYLDSTKVFEEETDNVILHYNHALTFGFYLQDGTVRLAGSISNVPNPSASNAIEPNPDSAETSTKSYVQLNSDSEDLTAPDGNVIKMIIAKEGEVTRTDNNHLVVSGRCIETKDLIHETWYDFRLEITIASVE